MPVCDYLRLTINEACCLCDALHGQAERLHGEHAADVLDRAMFDALDFDRRDCAWDVMGSGCWLGWWDSPGAGAVGVGGGACVLVRSSLPISDRLTFVGLLERQPRIRSR